MKEEIESMMMVPVEILVFYIEVALMTVEFKFVICRQLEEICSMIFSNKFSDERKMAIRKTFRIIEWLLVVFIAFAIGIKHREQDNFFKFVQRLMDTHFCETYIFHSLVPFCLYILFIMPCHYIYEKIFYFFCSRWTRMVKVVKGIIIFDSIVGLLFQLVFICFIIWLEIEAGSAHLCRVGVIEYFLKFVKV